MAARLAARRREATIGGQDVQEGCLLMTPERARKRPAVEVAHLRKSYGTLTAVNDVSFSVAEGEIFGLLGPNGAGKTTTVECVIGLRSPDWVD